MSRMILAGAAFILGAAGIGTGFGDEKKVEQPKAVQALPPLPIDAAFGKAKTAKELDEALLNDPTYKKAVAAALKAKKEQEDFFRKNKGAVGSSPAQAARVAFLATLSGEESDEDQPIKADVLIKDDDKGGKAKVGQTVGVDIQYAVVPPFPGDFKVTIDGKAVASEDRVTPVLVGGRRVVGVQNTTVYFRAAGKGKQKVVVEYKRGSDTQKRDVELEVTQ